ncbi:MAG: methyl-accepting chemotaxis protein [Geovibrio sp.]|nr:methyl-accepting chemotaxis protein [Geovibrio sp.]
MLLIKKMIFRRLEDMERIFSTIASGDYTVRVRIKRNDEVGKLGIAVNKMVDGTSQALSNVVDSISSLASTAAQLAKNSETIAKNAQNQAEQAASTATAVEEISGTVAEVAEKRWVCF